MCTFQSILIFYMIETYLFVPLVFYLDVKQLGDPLIYREWFFIISGIIFAPFVAPYMLYKILQHTYKS
jgi:hypothetical protein